MLLVDVPGSSRDDHPLDVVMWSVFGLLNLCLQSSCHLSDVLLHLVKLCIVPRTPDEVGLSSVRCKSMKSGSPCTVEATNGECELVPNPLGTS